MGYKFSMHSKCILTPPSPFILILSLALCLLAPLKAVGQTSSPVIQIHEGAHWIWYAPEDIYQAHKADIQQYYAYADRAFEYLSQSWGLHPKKQHFDLFVRQQTGGAFAAGDIGEVHAVTGKTSPGIGVSYDAFYNVANGIKGYWGYVLITHEMVNLFTGQIVSGGWPVDWWADHVSPFPLMTAVQIEYALVPQVAIYHGRQLSGPLEKMFVHLKEQFGWALFRRAFRAAIQDGINWDRLGANPSALRTNYVAAYLQLGTRTNLTPYMDGVVPNFNETTVQAILRARKRWRSLPDNSAKRKKLQKAYLNGHYQP